MNSTMAGERLAAAPVVAPLLTMSDVEKQYANGPMALAGVDLTVAPREFVSVVGPSGCGKSSLLRVAAGLIPPSRGVVRRHTDQVGFVFQTPALLPWRTVRANVELFGELRRIPAQERRRRVDETIKLVGLDEFADHRPRALSGGMRMRASLARALITRPELFLFDEPFGALDEITRQRLGDELLQLFLVQRFGVLFVTHSLTEAVYLSTRVIVLSGRPGRVLGDFPVPFGYPRSPGLRFTREFAELAQRVEGCLRGDGG